MDGFHLKDAVVEASFGRLSSRNKVGKTHLERTSALMYFLAFDAVVRQKNNHPLDFNPRSAEGKNNRDAMTLEYARLVQLQNTPDGQIRHIANLGRVDTGGIPPDKRISSNFFTVPLKKASQSAKRQTYPNRPAPLLKMGLSSTGLGWGIDYDDDWKINLPKMMSEMKGGSPFTDLAIVVFRGARYETNREYLVKALTDKIPSKYTEDLARYWAKKIDTESPLIKQIDDPYQTSLPRPFINEPNVMKSETANPISLRSLDKEALIRRIVYLERLLKEHDIKFLKDHDTR